MHVHMHVSRRMSGGGRPKWTSVQQLACGPTELNNTTTNNNNNNNNNNKVIVTIVIIIIIIII